MSESDIVKKEQPDPDEILMAITSFNDPAIITNIFKELNWTYSFEIREWLEMARQNANLTVKSKALIQLRKLLREAAEASGYVANVSSTAPNAQGGYTTFSAKRISGILNPAKKIESTEIKEPKNDKIKEPQTESKSYRGSDRRQGQDTSDQFPSDSEGCPRSTSEPERDAESGRTEPSDDRETPREMAGGTNKPTADSGKNNSTDSPCIKTRPPTCDRALFPGVSSAEG